MLQTLLSFVTLKSTSHFKIYNICEYIMCTAEINKKFATNYDEIQH